MGALRIRLRRGLDLRVPGAPGTVVEAAASPRSVALLGLDARGIRPSVHVKVGDRLALGETLFADRRRPEIRFVAPASGVVSAVHLGDMRGLESLVIDVEGDRAVAFEPVALSALEGLGREGLTGRLLEAGAWPALRERPFGAIADPARPPAAIFVRAIDTEPLAPDTSVVLAGRAADLALGLAAVAELTDGPVFVCARPGTLTSLEAHPRLRVVEFVGPHPAGLVGTHVHHLFSVRKGVRVWYLGVQDVLAIGHLLRTGRIDPLRVVALAGPAVRRPRLLKTRLGASTEDLARGELDPEPCRIVSGSPLSGRRAASRGGFLGRYDEQVCVLPEEEERDHRSWSVPLLGRDVRVPPWLPGPSWGRAPERSQHGLLPLDGFDRVVPMRLPVALLLRALASGDHEAARRLGALELEEEDLALCAYLCPSRLPYGALLREALSAIEAELP